MNNKLVNFGKYKDQPVEVMMEDKSYCDWFLSQTDMTTKYAWIFQSIQNAIQMEDTPEHNALQMRFMKKDYCINLGNYVYELNKNNPGAELFETKYTLFNDGENVKDEIIHKLSEQITRIILKEFSSSITIFNVYGGEFNDEYKNSDFEELKERYFNQYDLLNYFEYFINNNNSYLITTDTSYNEKKKKMDNIINEIKEDILLNLKTILSFKDIGNDEYKVYFYLNSQTIKFEFYLERGGFYADDKLIVHDPIITTYEDNDKKIIPQLIKEINENNNFKSSAEPIFEKHNIDVIYDFYPSKKSFDYNLGFVMKIELKPIICEDYMGILRKANSDKVNVVFCDKITAQSADIEDIKKAYKKHNIDLVVATDLELNILPSKIILNPLEQWIEKIDLMSIDGKCKTEDIKELFIEAMTK